MKGYASFILFLFLFGVVLAAPFEVFLSCTSDDIHNGFSDHLYIALKQEGIRTFRTKDGIPTGEKMCSTTRRALETSEVVVVVFTKDYAKFIACLDELVWIMELGEIDLLKLVTVYLNVNRMDVKEQTGPYYEAFALLESRLEGKMDIVEKYRTAFREAGEINGPSLMNGYESPFLDTVVREVKNMLNIAKPNTPSYFNWRNLLVVVFMLVIVLVTVRCQRKQNSQEKVLLQGDGKERSSAGDGKERSPDASS